MNKLLIFDLDDTLFETKSIGEKPVKPIIDEFEKLLISKYGQKLTRQIINDLWKYPFDFVASKYQFNNHLNSEFVCLVNETEFKFNITPFKDFNIIRNLKLEKILVTTGLAKLQNAKIHYLGIESEFNDIFIDEILDPERIFKKGIFKNILSKRKIAPDFVYIIGDNPNSELKAGFELGLNTIQVSKFGQEKSEYANYNISDFKELIPILTNKT